MTRLLFTLIVAIGLNFTGTVVSAFAGKTVLQQKSYKMKTMKVKTKRFMSLLKKRKLKAAKRLLPQLGPLAFKSKGGQSKYRCGLSGCHCVNYADCWKLAVEKNCTVHPLPGPAGPFVGTCTPGR